MRDVDVTLACGCMQGFAIGAFFSMMSASFAYEDPLLRQQTQAALNNKQKAAEIFKEMGRGMWKSGKGFGKVGALFAGLECVMESVRVIEILHCSIRVLTIGPSIAHETTWSIQ